jgi:hypothetical protein
VSARELTVDVGPTRSAPSHGTCYIERVSHA